MSAHDPPLESPAVFTTLPREDWSRYRAQLAQLSPRNARTLESIDSALFHVCLSDYTPANRTERINLLMTGCPEGVFPTDKHKYNWHPQWYDKCWTLHVTPEAEAGVCFEHSPYDGQTVAHMMNECWSNVQGLTDTVPAQLEAEITADQLKKLVPAALGWDWSPSLNKALAHAVKHYSDLVSSNLTTALEFDLFGTDRIKQLGVSPDGFLQFSFQLAYARMHQSVTRRPASSALPFLAPFSVYESCSTKRWRYGRTEAIRSVTPESTQAIGKFLFENEDRAALKAAVKTAASAHRTRAQQAQLGKGVDRHLFSLYCIASRRAGDAPALFSDKGWATLNLTQISSSNVNGPGVEMIGFGAVCPPGYGVGYTVEKHKIKLSVSNWTSTPDTGGGGFGGVKREVEEDVENLSIKTDSQKYVEILKQTFIDLAALLSEPDCPAPPRSRL